MTEDRQSLNLIQRALNRQRGLESSAPASVDRIASAQVPLPTSDLSASAGEAGAPTKSPPLPQPHNSTRLNMAAVRRYGMINPEIKTSTIANEFRNIKRKILLAARERKKRELVNNLVMVTSSLPGEGKTFTSMNLALSLAAEHDVQVLLIDCDLHRPSVGKFFEKSDQAGLVELLTNHQTDMQDTVRQCETVPNLSVIFAGKHIDDSPELIASAAMHKLLVAISERYSDRIIIIDTPPALTSFEPAILAPHVHQTIMVVSAQQAGRQQIEKALDSISGCQHISLLFNRAPKWEQKEGGYYYNYAARPEVA